MNINAGIIAQQVRGIAQRSRTALEKDLGPLDDTRARSVAFVLLCVKSMLALSEEEALQRLTEGGNDFGVDAIDVSDIADSEFVVTLFQGKYHHENLTGTRNFPQSGVEKTIQAVRLLFNPHQKLPVNPRLEARLEEIRSLILDGHLPRVRVLLCSNGASWKVPETQALIDAAAFGDRVTFQHVSHETLVRVLGSAQPINDSIQFNGKLLVEDVAYVRVLIGKVPIVEIARLMESHGDRLLDRNVRRYLGLTGNRVNRRIHATLQDEGERAYFFFYNNGITLVCERFDYNSLQPEHHKVLVSGLQIINGAQTSKTIELALRQLKDEGADALSGLEQAHVLVRLYQVPNRAPGEVGPDTQQITYATNNQNPVELRDLRSGDERQRRLEQGMRALGYEYRRQRSDAALTSRDISLAIAAEAVLAVWRERPQRAKFRGGDHFNAFYDEIFTEDLNAAQVVISVLLFRFAENKRKRPPAGAPEFIRYASYFVAMLMGRMLLADLGVERRAVDHRCFEKAHSLIGERAEIYFERAMEQITSALAQLYGGQDISAHRLAATFRRGDLFDYLDPSSQGA
ncbi:AIPR family protein [Haliangium ochraceum]|uniref:Abortive phage infection n=1 Tax=Haliangium ochraceum (strain DSM 14365 / JCM 11303 / SMP-2) TaxID=502025 RepID=D0LN52_HALO1|nr:AIPR family protein [Haliangium ochraceum]ACY15229.1 Abortive phage infection [Haliangium ochraceum DSM 14365]